MPIDPRIALGVQQQQVPTFLDLAGQAAQVRNLQAQPAMQQQQMRLNDLRIQGAQQNLDQQGLAMEAAKRKEAGIAALSELWGQYGDDDNQIVAGLNQRGFADMAQAFTEDRAKVKKDVFAAEKDKIETQAKQISLAGQILGSINNEQTLVRGVGQALANGLLDAQSAQEWLAGGWNEQTAVKVAQVRQQALTAQQQIEEIRKQAKDAEDLLRAPDERKKLAAEAAKAEQDAAGTAPLTAKDRAELELRRGTLDETRRANNIRAERLNFERAQGSGDMGALVEAVMQNPAFFDKLTPTQASKIVPALAARGFNPEDHKNPNASQSDALRYYQRAEKALKTIEALDKGMEDKGLIGQYFFKYGPRPLQSEANKSYSDAQRAFTEARLRQDSGAAIPPAEFENDARTYFPQPGDSAQQIKEKAEARRVVLESLRAESGRAYSQYYGTPLPKASNAPGANPGSQAKPKPTKRFNPATGQVEDIR